MNMSSGLGFLRQIRRQPLSEKILSERIDRTVDAINAVLDPEEIYLFGSATDHNQFDDQSDIDCLIVLPEKIAGRAWKSFSKIRNKVSWPIDLIFMSSNEFERKKIWAV